MAAWLAPALRAVLPHLGKIVSAVAPVFTRKKADAAVNQVQLLQDQIAELQSAVSQNATHIKELATQLQSTVSALEQVALVAEAKIRRAFWFSVAGLAFAVIGLAVAAFLIFTR
jgi:TolA-binding protein